MSTLYLLFESALGFGLFERAKADEIGMGLSDVQKSINNIESFSKLVKLKAFLPFTSAEAALENINAISQGEITPTLASWLEIHVPADKTAQLGVVDTKVGYAVSETLGIKCLHNELVLELIRGIRVHFVRYLKGISQADLHQAQLGLCHSFSRSKVKFNVHRLDTMIIQSISLLDQITKDVNTLTMRVREMYGVHFPELARIATDGVVYCKLAKLIKDRADLTPAALPAIVDLLGDDAAADQVIELAKHSMGAALADVDAVNLYSFVDRVVSLHTFHASLQGYVLGKMNMCAPNLTAILGETVGARLIAQAGSLTALAKYPASTVQILGAEKALFRALKTKTPGASRTPKHGLIFHSSFIARASDKNKGRISRSLANKCSIAARIDCFSEEDCEVPFYGQELRKQLEERLNFYKTGAAPRKNSEAMDAAKAALDAFNPDVPTTIAKADDDEETLPEAKKEKKEKKDKKEKKNKRAHEEAEPEDEEEEVIAPKSKKAVRA
jgi:RNA processing factor Prp31